VWPLACASSSGLSLTAVFVPDLPFNSVSGDATYRKHVFEMADFVKAELDSLGVTTRFVDLGKQTLDGQVIDLPPAILGWIGQDPKKKTVQLYAHYDVQPVSFAFSFVFELSRADDIDT